MPQYRYQFRDAHGKLMEGLIQAPDEVEAFDALRKKGISSPKILPYTPPAAVAPSVKKVIHTKKGTDKHRFFLFTQIGERLRAGINPVNTFQDMARMERNKLYKESLLETAKAANESKPISEVFALYPDLYPSHVAGMIRAGETGGFLPEAFMKLGEQANDAHKFKRFHWFFWLVIGNAIGVIPLIFYMRKSLLTAAEMTDRGSLSFGEVIEVFVQGFIRNYLPTLTVAIILALILRWVFLRRELTAFRHRLGLKAPIYGSRARNENVRYFVWTLNQLSKAGIYPQTAWTLASEAVPNVAVQEQLVKAGQLMNANSKVSEAVFGSKLFPEEYAPMISTGEMVGNISGALEHLEDASRTEFGVSSTRARYQSMSFGCTLFLITGGIVLIVMVKTWYPDLIKAIVPKDSDGSSILDVLPAPWWR